MKKQKLKFSLFARLTIVFFVFTIFLLAVATLSPRLADLINSGISQPFRAFMASLTNPLRFSLFELIVFSSPLIIFLVIYFAIARFSAGFGIRFVINFLAVVLLIFAAHSLTLSIGYRTTAITDKLGLPDPDPTTEKLVRATEILCDEVNSLAYSVPRSPDGVFVSACTYPELSEKISDSYSALTKSYPLPENFKSTIKPIRASGLISRLRITGLYSFLTGEVNVSSAYPSYDTIFTAAHEMSHQRGIIREDEANFLAYLLTSTSPDPELQYSAALSMYSYFSSVLYSSSPEAYSALSAKLCAPASADLTASRSITERYGNTSIADLSDRVINSYLESNGTDGISSYSRVIELVIAYFEMKN